MHPSFQRACARVFAPLLLALPLSMIPAPVRADAPARSLPAGVTAGPAIEGIGEYTLGNGLQVLLFPDASKPTVTVNVVYRVGSVREGYGETGMAHLLEHMLFKGTPAHPDIPGGMKQRGIRYDAATSVESTMYFEAFPAGDDTLRWVIGLEADRMVHSNIAKADLDSEMTVVRNELEKGENNPGRMLDQQLRAAAFLWHGYGRSTIGARSDVETVPVENLRAFYRTWYQPDAATLVVAGKIDPAKTLAWIADDFGRIPKPSRVLPAARTVEPPQDGERNVLVRGTGNQRLVEAGYHIPAMAQADSAPLRLLADILGSTPGGRLHHALIEGGLAAGAGASADWLRDPGLFVASAVVSAGADASKTRDALLAQLEGLAAHPVTQQELDGAKRRIANGFDLYFTDVNAVGMGLSTFIAAGDWRLLFLARDAIAAATVADVNRVAAAYLRPANRTLAEFVPVATPDPVKVPAASGLAERAAAYTGRKALDAGEDFEPTLANIDARTQRFTIGDGLEVRLLPKRTRGGTVTVDADFRFGDERSLAASPEPAGSIAGAMLMRGSASMDRAQVAARFTALETQARVSGGAQGANITLLTRRDRLADALSLAADVLRHPAYPQGEFEQLRMQAITGIEAGRREPGGIASFAMARHFDPWPAGHPLRVKSPAERVAALKALPLDAVRAFHHDFYGSSRGTIAIVGDFDPAAVRQQLQALFAGWDSPKPYAPIPTHYTAVKPERQQFETPGKSNAVLLARLNLPLRVTDPDYPAMLAANDILGGSTLKSRLGDRIRQKEGLSYGVRSQLHGDDSLDGGDDAGSLEISAIAAPQNIAKVETAVREELARLVKDGVTDAELRDSVNSLLTSRRQSLAVDGNIAAMLGELAFFHRDIAFEQDMQARIAALTVADVDAALRKRLHPEDLSVYAAGDFAGAATAGAAAANGGSPAASGSGAVDAPAAGPGGQ